MLALKHFSVQLFLHAFCNSTKSSANSSGALQALQCRVIHGMFEDCKHWLQVKLNLRTPSIDPQKFVLMRRTQASISA